MESFYPKTLEEYIGYKDEQNLRVQGPNNPEEPFLEAFPNVPAEGKYIIKFSEDYIYESGDLIEITFDPKGLSFSFVYFFENLLSN